MNYKITIYVDGDICYEEHLAGWNEGAPALRASAVVVDMLEKFIKSRKGINIDHTIRISFVKTTT